MFIVPGNHDFLLEFEWSKDECREFQALLDTLTSDKVEILIDSITEYEGVTFYGTPWIAPIHWQTWAFEDIQNEYDEYICPYERYKTVIYLLLMKILIIMKSLNITVLVNISIISLGIGMMVYHMVI